MLKKRVYHIARIESEAQAKQVEKMILAANGIVEAQIDRSDKKITIQYESMILNPADVDSIMKKYGAVLRKKDEKHRAVSKRVRIGLFFLAWIFLIVIHVMYTQNIGSDAFVRTAYLVLVTLIHSYFASYLHEAFVQTLKENRYSLDTHFAIGMFFIYVQNMYSILTDGNNLYTFFSFGCITLHTLVHRLAECNAFKKQNAISFLTNRIPSLLTIDRKGKKISVASEEILPGDCVVVPKNTFFTVDGEIIHGETVVNDNLISGIDEARPVGEGATVYQGVRNLENDVTVRATVAGNNTKLKHILNTLEQLELETQRRQHTVNNVVSFFAVVHIGVSLFMFIIKCIFDTPLDALFHTGMALTSFCSPVLFLVPFFLSLIGKKKCKVGGVQLMNLAQLDDLAEISAVIFDTKGVLTKGVYEVVRTYRLGSWTELQIIAMACSVIPEGLEDPDYEAILREGEQIGEVMETDEFSAVLLGTIEFMEEQGIYVEEARGIVKKHEACGQTVMGVAVENRVVGLIVIGDDFRSEVRQVTATLNNMNLRPYVISSESEAAVHAITDNASVGHTIICHDVPEKCERIAQIRRLGNVVATVAFSDREMPIVDVSGIGFYFVDENIPEYIPGHVLCTKENLTLLPHAINTARRVRKHTELATFVTCVLSLVLLIAAFLGLKVTWDVLLLYTILQTVTVSVLAIVRIHTNVEERN